MVAKLSFILDWIALFFHRFITYSNFIFIYILFDHIIWTLLLRPLLLLRSGSESLRNGDLKKEKKKKSWPCSNRAEETGNFFWVELLQTDRQSGTSSFYNHSLGGLTQHARGGRGGSTHFSNHERAWLADARHRQTFKAHHERPTDSSSLLESTFKLG